MNNTLALLLAAGGVGFGHAVLPDHWVPLAVVGRAQRYPLAKVARLSGLAGVAHVLVSVTLGGAIIVVGLPLRNAVQHAQDAIIGTLLILTGAGFLTLELSGHGHSHGPGHAHQHGQPHSPEPARAPDHPSDRRPGSHREHEHEHRAPARTRLGWLASIMVPFGAAASPDLTILPVFLAATAAGAGAAIGCLLVFAAVTITTIVGLTLFATAGGYQLSGAWLDRWGNLFTAMVLAVIGTLVLAGWL